MYCESDIGWVAGLDFSFACDYSCDWKMDEVVILIVREFLDGVGG